MFSDRIARLRKERGLNQKQLAEKLEVSVDSVRRWEQGKRSPDVEMLRNIARVLNTTVSYISGETNDASAITIRESSDGSELTNMSERSITEKDRALVYEDGAKRFEFPTTPEGYKMFQMLIDRTIPIVSAITNSGAVVSK